MNPAIDRLKTFAVHPRTRNAAFAFSGALAGFAYYYFIGCSTGTCPITSSPYISTAYGAVIGLLLSPNKKKTTPNKETSS